MGKLAKSMKFQIGDRVLIKAVACAEYNANAEKTYDRTIESHKLDEPIEAVITGLKRFFQGKTSPPSQQYYYSSNEQVYEPGYLDVSSSVLCWEFRRGLLNKPEYAFEEDIELNRTVESGTLRFKPPDCHDKFPLLHTTPCPWDDRVHEEYSKAASLQKRDEKGRFIKENGETV